MFFLQSDFYGWNYHAVASYEVKAKVCVPKTDGFTVKMCKLRSPILILSSAGKFKNYFIRIMK